MGAGKSTVAALLSQKLDLPLLDLDTEIEKQAGQKVPQIIINKGELHFRRLERAVLEDLLQKKAFILALGGGTPCYYDNMKLINRSAASFYLKAGVKELYNRLEGSQSKRPLIAAFSGQELLEYIGKHLFERSHFYEDAIYTIPTQKLTASEVTQAIVEKVS